MHKVVLGGGLASGKSSVAAMMREQGIEVESLDAIAASVRDEPQVAQEIAARFGEDVLDGDGRVIPARLAERAFASAEETEALNAIVHPRIAEAARAFLEADGDSGPAPARRIRVLEVPLLDKAPDLVTLANEVVVVTAPLDRRIELAVGRGMDEGDARARIARQASDEDLRALADTVIENTGSLEDLRARVWVWTLERDAPAGLR